MTLESITRILRITTSRPVLLAVAAGSLLLLVGECNAFRGARRADSAPRIAVNAPRFERYRPDVTEASIRTYVPPERLFRKLEQDFGVNIRGEGETEGADLLAHKVIPPMPDGGELIVTLPGGEGAREVEVTLLPKPRRLLGLRSEYEVGALYGRGLDGEARGRAWAAVEPLRFGRLHLRGEAGVDLRGGESDAYALVGVVWRSR